jgi:HK97 family phage portal protein
MNLFGLNINISRASAPVKRSIDPSLQSWLRGDDLDQGGATLSNAYQQLPWVYRTVNVIAEQVANTPFVFSMGDRGRENLITTGPLPDFYNRPNPHLNSFQYWELRIMWLMLRGECFRIPIFEKRKLTKILILDPANFQHIIDDHELVGWRYTGFSRETPLESQLFLPSEVWFERLPNPFSHWRGLAPLYAADMAVHTDFAASAFMRGLIENNADLGVIVRTDQQLSDEQQTQILADLRNRKRKAGSADKPLLLFSGATVEKPQLSSSDLQFLENRKFSRAEICAAFGVPEEIVTTTDHAKYDVMQGARLNFIENRIIPLCRRLEAEEQHTIKAIDPKATGWFDVDTIPIMQEAQRTRLAAAKVGFDMGIPFNELNRVFDLGFKTLPWGNTGYIHSSMQPAGNLPPTAQLANPKPQLENDSLSQSKAALEQLTKLLNGKNSSVPSPQ